MWSFFSSCVSPGFGFVNVSLDQKKIMKKMLMSIVSSTDGKNVFVLQICFYQEDVLIVFGFELG